MEYKKGWNTISKKTFSVNSSGSKHELTTHEPEGAKWIYMSGYIYPGN